MRTRDRAVIAEVAHSELLPPARPFPSSIFLDKNRRDIGKSQSIWTDSKMETAGSRGVAVRALVKPMGLLGVEPARELDLVGRAAWTRSRRLTLKLVTRPGVT
jgi:hypothetical protein